MNDILEVVLNDNKKISVTKGTTVREIVLNNEILENPIIGVKINNEIVSFDTKINNDCSLYLFDVNDIIGYKMYQAGLKLIMEVALKNNFPGLDVMFDHSIGHGIHTTIINKKDFNKNDVETLKNKMQDIINNDLKIVKLNVNSTEAINYYNKMGYHEKALNIHNITNQIITLYKLDKYINYFYVDMPDTTGVINKFDLVYIKDGELALMLPSPQSNNNVLEYVHYAKIIDCFKEGKDWLGMIGIPFISSINKIVSDGYSNDIVRSCEMDFDNHVYIVAKTAIEKGTKFLMIAGPSSSGKTTTAKKITLNLFAQGVKPILISTDDYFLDRDKTPKNADGSFDYEGIGAMDIDKLNHDLNALVAGEIVKLPTYNFIDGKQEYNNPGVKLADNGIIVMEGLHCLNDQLTPNLKKELKLKVYLSPFIPVNIDCHNYISTTDLRLIRRIVRDNINRGYDVSKTIDSWQTVRKGEEKNIFPFIDQADMVINTSLAYELGVLKVYVLPLLYSVTNDSPYFAEARRLIFFLRNFFPISSEYVGHYSILREFIGGSNFRNEGDK